jgi:hypothetical protein
MSDTKIVCFNKQDDYYENHNKELQAGKHFPVFFLQKMED